MSFHNTHPHLATFVGRKNVMRSLLGEELYDLRHLTHGMKKALTQDLACELSPENLCCDGELSGADLEHKTRYLMAVKAELESYA